MTEEAHARIADLSAPECWERAASRPVGRLAWNTPRGPTVIPVNFTVDGKSVLVRTTAYSGAAREADDGLVSFEVDSIDTDTRSGWSVLMRGRAVRATLPETQGGPEPWVAGPRSLVLRVEVDEITGRVLHVGS